MGFKNLKEHYRIVHYVCVTKEGICIGSPYIHDLIVVGLDGKIKKLPDNRVNEDLIRYVAEMKADPEKLREVVLSTDKFDADIPVYTYDGGTIVEKKCEKLGWPNVTHDGHMMYENTFSNDKSLVVHWAKTTAVAEIRWSRERCEEKRRELNEAESHLKQAVVNLGKLEADYPEVK